MKRFLMSRIPLLLVVLCPMTVLAGCGLLDVIFGTGPGGGATKNSPPSDAIGGLVGTVVPGGAALIGMLRWGYIEYRHHQLVKAGKRDDDKDGIEDPPAPPATS